MTPRTERPAGPAGRSAPAVPDTEARFDEWVTRIRSTHRAVAYTCAHRLSDPAQSGPLAVRVVAGLLARPTVFRYFGLPFSGRIASLAEALIAQSEAGNPIGPADWPALEARVLAMPDHHRDVMVAVCVDGDDVAALAVRLGCTEPDAVRRRAETLAFMRDHIAGDLATGPDEGR